MRTTRRTLIRGIPLIIVLAVAATACADGDTATDPTAAGTDAAAELSEAAAATLDEPRMSFHLAFEIEGPDVDEAGSIEGAGDFESSRGNVTTTANGTPEQRAVFDGTDFWLTSSDDAFTSVLPDGREWVHGDLLEIGDNAMVRELDSLVILYLLNGARAVTAEAGSEATRYAFDVDMSAAADSAPSSRRDEVRALIDTGDVEPTVTGEAVVGTEGYVRELTVRGNDGQEPSVDISWKARFDDFGEPVAPEHPAAGEVVELDAVPELRDAFFSS